MRLNREKLTFGRHETFPLRYGWLTKGFNAVKQKPDLFNQPEQAMVMLGVGRNMVNAIHYWLHAVGVVDFDTVMGKPTPLGDALLGDSGDGYLEDDATLWIIHWLLASNAELATGVYWFFNRFAMPRFQDQEVLRGLDEFIAQELPTRRRSTSTLKSEVSTLLRMYAPEVSQGDESLDSPLAPLQLIEAEGNGRYRSLRALRPYLPPVALHFALSQRFEAEPRQAALSIRAVLYGDGDWAAMGAIFRLNEEGLMAILTKVMEDYPNCYELRDTAGVHQIYRGKNIVKSLDVLRSHYQKDSA
ncbi:DUF4007 domain-containing protein [Gammaproteobacteria bacterium]